MKKCIRTSKKLKRSSKISSKRSAKRSTKRSSKRSTKRSSKRSSKKKDGGLGPSKFDFYIKEKEEIKNIIKRKVVNFDQVLKELQKDEDILSKYFYNNERIEEKFLDYIKYYIKKPIRIRIHSLVTPKTEIYKDVKNYLLNE